MREQTKQETTERPLKVGDVVRLTYTGRVARLIGPHYVANRLVKPDYAWDWEELDTGYRSWDYERNMAMAKMSASGEVPDVEENVGWWDVPFSEVVIRSQRPGADGTTRAMPNQTFEDMGLEVRVQVRRKP